MTSTVKALACARVYELGLENQSAPISVVEPVTYSPVYGSIEPNTQISLKQACRTALSTSDNRAANFIFKLTGGPQALTAWLREKGDTTTRSDRIEATLNLSGKNEYRDTTTPSNATLNWQWLDTQLTPKAHHQWLADLATNKWPTTSFEQVFPKIGVYTIARVPDPMTLAQHVPSTPFWLTQKGNATMPHFISRQHLVPL